MISGGIDLGGTKIEARLFDAALNTVELRRIPTPTGDFDSFLAGLSEQVRWLEEQAGDAALPVGVGLPGLIDPQTGRAFASNIPVTGRDLPGALAQALGRPVPMLNDCQAFALSEAHSGAGAGHGSVVGLIMGTGIGAGHALDGALPHRLNGSALEIGHMGLPAHALGDLPLRRCGCGKTGCYETVLAGPGLTWLSGQMLGEAIPPADLSARALAGDAQAEAVLDRWATLAGELLLAIQLAHDPDCIVLGGGVSKMPGVTERLTAALDAARLGAMRLPVIAVAQHGDSSGARGAALHAISKG